jgi:hypothetical protein
MTERSGASAGRKSRPKVRIEVKREKIRRSFALSKEALQILDSYVTFLESHLGGKVTVDQVIEERIMDLARDRLWKDWTSKAHPKSSEDQG